MKPSILGEKTTKYFYQHPLDYKLQQVQESIEHLRKVYEQDQHKMKNLHTNMESLHEEVKEHHTSPVKTILKGLGIAFLSACTARYWIGKLEPVVEDYITKHAQPPAVVQTIDDTLQPYR